MAIDCTWRRRPSPLPCKCKVKKCLHHTSEIYFNIETSRTPPRDRVIKRFFGVFESFFQMQAFPFSLCRFWRVCKPKENLVVLRSAPEVHGELCPRDCAGSVGIHNKWSCFIWEMHFTFYCVWQQHQHRNCVSMFYFLFICLPSFRILSLLFCIWQHTVILFIYFFQTFYKTKLKCP